VRDFRASYKQSLMVLRVFNEFDPEMYTKSSLTLSLGETEQEVIETMKELRSRKVSILTIDQYLQPSLRHMPVTEYIPSEWFDWFAEAAKQIELPMLLLVRWLEARTRQGNF
jgi:lipoyl synthase